MVKKSQSAEELKSMINWLSVAFVPFENISFRKGIAISDEVLQIIRPKIIYPLGTHRPKLQNYQAKES